MKKIYSFLVMMVMLFAFSGNTYAAENNESKDAIVDNYVVDTADVLSSSEEEKLNTEFDEIFSKNDYGIYVVYIEKVPDGRDVQDYADDIYDASECGYGKNGSGALLLVCTKTGDRCISSKGDGVKAYNEKAVKYVGKKLAKLLDKDDYYKTAQTFSDESVMLVERLRDGKNPVPTNWPKTALISFVIALVIALIIVGVMKSELKSVAKQERADCYTRDGSMKVTGSREFFLYRNVERTKKQQNDGSSTAHTSSSGSTHGGGKF